MAGLRHLLALLLVASGAQAAAVDPESLWDFRDPALSERRFREALKDARGDDALVLTTQVARTYGLRREFERAREILAAIEPQARAAGAEVRVRHRLEWGRTFASATHPPALRTPQALAEARASFETALRIARESRLDGLAIDAIHMLAFVDTAPEDQLRWAREALAVVESSPQAAAKRWEASVRQNAGYALFQLGRHDEALAELRRSLAARERDGNAAATRVTRWMQARVLRAKGDLDEALAIQLRLEREGDAAGRPDPHVFGELATLYAARGDAQRASHYDSRRKALEP